MEGQCNRQRLDHCGIGRENDPFLLQTRQMATECGRNLLYANYTEQRHGCRSLAATAAACRRAQPAAAHARTHPLALFTERYTCAVVSHATTAAAGAWWMCRWCHCDPSRRPRQRRRHRPPRGRPAMAARQGSRWRPRVPGTQTRTAALPAPLVRAVSPPMHACRAASNHWECWQIHVHIARCAGVLNAGDPMEEDSTPTQQLSTPRIPGGPACPLAGLPADVEQCCHVGACTGGCTTNGGPTTTCMPSPLDWVPLLFAAQLHHPKAARWRVGRSSHRRQLRAAWRRSSTPSRQLL